MLLFTSYMLAYQLQYYLAGTLPRVFTAEIAPIIPYLLYWFSANLMFLPSSMVCILLGAHVAVGQQQILEALLLKKEDNIVRVLTSVYADVQLFFLQEVRTTFGKTTLPKALPNYLVVAPKKSLPLIYM